MSGFIVTGSQQARESYVNSFIIQHSLPSYAIRRLEGKIKIDDVHSVIRSTKIQAGKKEKRLVILEGTITIPAQNALLKFLEELQETDVVVFSQKNKDELLDTIISRCKIVSLEVDINEQRKAASSDLNIKDLTNEEFIMLAVDVNDIQAYENLLLDIRENLVTGIISHEYTDITHLVQLLKKLHLRYKTVKENNVNPKLSVETITVKE